VTKNKTPAPIISFLLMGLSGNGAEARLLFDENKGR
jgi:hypothetical protein